MKKTAKTFLLVISLITICFLAGICANAASDYGNVIEVYKCDDEDCDFGWTLYDSGTLVFNSNNIGGHYVYSMNTTKVKEVVINEDIDIYSPLVLRYLDDLEKITVLGNHPEYTSVDGVLYSKDMTKIRLYPKGRTDYSFTIPSSVTDISGEAFYEAKIKYITIPANVKYIGPESFMYSKLESVIFERGERNLVISYTSFTDCENLNYISLDSKRVYCITSSSFSGTAFYNNESNWDNGVLYLGDILLATRPTELSPEYAIKDGTKTIANSAKFVYYASTDENGNPTDSTPVNVKIPESVDNIGFLSVLKYDKFPENIFRVESITSIFELLDENNEAFMSRYEEISTAFEDVTTAEELQNFEKKYGSWFLYSQEGWIMYMTQSIKPSLPDYYCLNPLCIIDDDLIGFADGSWISLGTLLVFTYNGFLPPLESIGVILSPSFNNLTGYTPLSNLLVELVLDFYESLYDSEFDLSGETVTFLNKECVIFDDADTIWEGYTICGYTGSTAEAYAKKYNRTFIDITNCTHERTVERYHVVPKTNLCTAEEITGDIYCQYCGKLLKEGGEKIPAKGHTFEKEVTPPSCFFKGYTTYTCTVCGYTYEGDETPTQHVLGEWEEIRKPTCTQQGRKEKRCIRCSITFEYEFPEELAHIDNNKDGICDVCNNQICWCNCHESGIINIFFKIVLFFQKIFKQNKYCACGIVHY